MQHQQDQRGGLFDSLRAAIATGKQTYNANELTKKINDSRSTFCKYHGSSPECSVTGGGAEPAWLNYEIDDYQGGAYEDSEYDDEEIYQGGFLDSLRASLGAARKTYKDVQYKKDSEKSFTDFCKYHSDSAMCQVSSAAPATSTFTSDLTPSPTNISSCPQCPKTGGRKSRKRLNKKSRGAKRTGRKSKVGNSRRRY